MLVRDRRTSIPLWLQCNLCGQTDTFAKIRFSAAWNSLTPTPPAAM
jgi:hypothetical protein